MKQLQFCFLFICINVYANAQNVGIGTTTPSRKFTVRQDGIGITQENSAGAVQVGFFINNSVAFLQTHTAHPLAFSTNNGSSQMLLSTAGSVVIGTTNPTLAGLVADKKVGAVNALFGSNTTGVSIESNYPGIGLNTYYNAGRKSISEGYGGWMGLDSNTGNLIFQSSATAGTAGADISPTTKLLISKDGLVSIGTETPNATAQLHVDVGNSTTKGLLVTGVDAPIGVFSVPDIGEGSRLMFYPGKVAFRAGYVGGTEWDNANVGYYSTATGANIIASGNFSTATGYFTTTSGLKSTAIGAMVNTNSKDGAFAIGDSDPSNEGYTNSALHNQFTARFWNGYYLLTSGNNTRFGVSIGHNGNAWVSICDSNRKENIEPLNGEEVL